MEVERGLNDIITNNIKDTLIGQSFKRFTMTIDIQLVPQYNWSAGAAKKIKN